MELIAAALGTAEVAAKASSGLWKLCEKWHNAPRDIFELRDEIDRATRLYATVQSHILDSSTAGSTPPSFDSGAAAARELDLLLIEGLGVVSRLQDLIDQLLDEQSPGQPRADSVLKRRRLNWLRNLPTARHLKRSLRQNTEQVGVQLVLLNILMTSTLPNRRWGLQGVEHIVPVTETARLSSPDSTTASTSETLLASPVDDAMDGEKNRMGSMAARNWIAVDEGVAIPDFQKPTTPIIHAVDVLTKGFEEMVPMAGDRVDVYASVDTTPLESGEHERLSYPIGDLVNRLVNHPNALGLVSGPPDKRLQNDAWGKLLEAASSRVDIFRECDRLCRCSCHSPKSSWSWSVTGLTKLLGSMRISVTGFSLYGSHTDPNCVDSGTDQRICLQYRLPDWVVSTTVSLFYSSLAGQGPELLLRVRRRVIDDMLNTPIESSLFGSIFRGRTEITKRLITSRRCSVYDEIENGEGKNALHFAIRCTNIAALQVFLAAGGDIYQTDDNGLDAATLAFRRVIFRRRGWEQYLEIIPFDRHIEDEGYLDLHRVLIGLLPLKLEDVLKLPRFKAQINSPTSSGFYPLDFALDAEAARLLCKAGADPNRSNGLGLEQPRLLLAAAEGDLDVTEALLDFGADVNMASTDGLTPLMRAIVPSPGPEACAAMVEMLLRRGADINRENVSKQRAVGLAAAVAHPECLAILLRGEPAKDFVSESGENALTDTFVNGSALKAGMLLCYGVDYHIIVTNGRNILHKLAQTGTMEMISIFECLDFDGVDAHLVDTSGKTPTDYLWERTDATAEFKDAFQSLVSRISSGCRVESDESERDRVRRALYRMPRYIELQKWLSKWDARNLEKSKTNREM